jgi:lysophospholipase L1-like esterase
MFKLAGKIIFALVVSLVVWEILLRIFVVVPIPYRHDPAIGWMPKPYSSGLFTLEGRGVCNYNEFGFRGETIGDKKPGEFRIVALGDSYTEGQQMNIEQTFPAQLQQLLNEKPLPDMSAPSVRVFNGGRGGSSPAYSVQLAEEYKKIFQPDWVVMLINDGNWVTIFDPTTEIYYRPVGEGLQMEVQWKWNKMSRPLKLLMQWRVRDLAVFQYAFSRLGTIMAARAKAANDGMTTAQSAEEQKARFIREEKAIDLTMRQLRERYPRLVVVHIPVGAASNGLPPPLESEGFLIKACERYGVPLIAMRDRIIKDYSETRQPPYGFYNTLPWMGHPNAHGHKLVAQALYEFFMDKLEQTDTGSSNSGTSPAN